jgi:predicted nuclease of predicted toxin-antitoxin system
MKILLDECLPLDFRHKLTDHETHTAEWAGLKGKKNGELLRIAELAGYQVLLTVDQGMLHQQNLSSRKISIISVRAKTNQMEDLITFVVTLLEALRTIRPGQVLSIE